MNLTLRRGKLSDAEACGAVCFQAFKTVAEAYHFTPDFPSADMAVELLGWMLGHAGFYGVVAELGGRVVGSNFLDERNGIEPAGAFLPSVAY